MNKTLEKLPPETLQTELKNRKSLLESAIFSISGQRPQGKLRISCSNNTTQYYQIDGKNRKYIHKKEIKLIRALAQKNYNEKLLPVLNEELAQINATLSLLQKNKIASIFNCLSLERQSLVEPVTLSNEEYTKLWQTEEYSHKPFHENAPNLFTAKGERVRSKSEIIIADTLLRLNIPYRYEFPVKLKKFTVHPDFYGLNVRTRQEFLWEHLGMMDLPEYSASTIEKLNAYQDAGFFPGKNLIISMETSESPLSSKKVEQLTKQYLA